MGAPKASLPPDIYALANRLSEAEAKLKAVEKALSALFHRVNVNRPGPPDQVLDRLLLSLAELLAALEKAHADPPGQVRRQSGGAGLSLSARTETSEGRRRVVLELDDSPAGEALADAFEPGPEDADDTPDARHGPRRYDEQ